MKLLQNGIFEENFSVLCEKSIEFYCHGLLLIILLQNKSEKLNFCWMSLDRTFLEKNC